MRLGYPIGDSVRFIDQDGISSDVVWTVLRTNQSATSSHECYCGLILIRLELGLMFLPSGYVNGFLTETHFWAYHSCSNGVVVANVPLCYISSCWLHDFNKIAANAQTTNTTNASTKPFLYLTDHAPYTMSLSTGQLLHAVHIVIFEQDFAVIYTCNHHTVLANIVSLHLWTIFMPSIFSG
jgi:hypothetical protein